MMRWRQPQVNTHWNRQGVDGTRLKGIRLLFLFVFVFALVLVLVLVYESEIQLFMITTKYLILSSNAMQHSISTWSLLVDFHWMRRFYLVVILLFVGNSCSILFFAPSSLPLIPHSILIRSLYCIWYYVFFSSNLSVYTLHPLNVV